MLKVSQYLISGFTTKPWGDKAVCYPTHTEQWNAINDKEISPHRYSDHFSTEATKFTMVKNYSLRSPVRTPE